MPSEPYAIQYSEAGRKSRKELPDKTQVVFLDVLDELSGDPNAFPGRTQTIDREGRIRIYAHPNPPLQITFEVDEPKHQLYVMHAVLQQVQVTKPLFISYSHKDAEWLAKLRMFLRPLEDQGLLRVWDDREIQAGALWMDDIRHSLETARVAVFLITQNFLNSEFIRDKEMPALLSSAKNRGCLVFWIAVSSSTVGDSEIAQFQAANDPSSPLDTLPEAKQNEVFKKIYDRMKEAVNVN